MEKDISTGGSLAEALETVRHFIAETTGKKPTNDEIADALKRYFVLNEIKAHILMTRQENGPMGKPS